MPTTLDLIKTCRSAKARTARRISFKPVPAPTGPPSTSVAWGRADRCAAQRPPNHLVTARHRRPGPTSGRREHAAFHRLAAHRIPPRRRRRHLRLGCHRRVMNYITRSDFTGLEVAANYKAVAGTDGDTEVGAIYGADLSDSIHIATSFSYIARSEMELVERDWAVQPYASNPRGGWSSVGRPAVFVPWNRFDQTPGGFTGLLLAGIVDPNCDKLGALALPRSASIRWAASAASSTRPSTTWPRRGSAGSGSANCRGTSRKPPP